MHKKFIYLLNGPKESGKDVLGEYLKSLVCNSEVFMFKKELYVWAAKIACIDLELFINYCTDRELKEQPLYLLPKNPATDVYFTPREWLIHCSENVIKPLAGQDYFGKACATEIANSGAASAFITDSGFDNEALALISAFSNERVFFTVVQIVRPGYTFEGDSRNYLSKSKFEYLDNVCFEIITNDKTLEDFLIAGAACLLG